MHDYSLFNLMKNKIFFKELYTDIPAYKGANLLLKHELVAEDQSQHIENSKTMVIASSEGTTIGQAYGVLRVKTFTSVLSLLPDGVMG